MDRGSTRDLRIRTPGGAVHDVPTRIGVDGRDYVLDLDVPEMGNRRIVGPDLFECLLRLRDELEPAGYRTLVNGARLNVWPSGMGRDMGGGRRAYVMTLGQHDRRPPLVDIFEPAAEGEIAVVADQRAFFERWIGEVMPDQP